MSTIPSDPTLETLAARVAALEQALASLQPHPPAPPGCVCSSATAGVPAVQATGSNGAAGVNASSDTGVGLITQSGGAISLLAVGGGAAPQTAGFEGAIVAEGGSGYGLWATSDSGTPAVYGHAPITGVAGSSTSRYGTGVAGWSTYGDGVYGWSDRGDGVVGHSNSGYGVAGSSDSRYGIAVAGWNQGGGDGVYGWSDRGDGVVGESMSAAGVVGWSPSGDGVVGASNWSTGVYGWSDRGDGVVGESFGLLGTGVHGLADDGYAVVGESVSGYLGIGVWGICPNGTAGQFDGNVNVTGSLWKPGGGFRIDHPLDPAHKYLSHSFVESSDMKNLYDGVVTLDAAGQAEVSLPPWFAALNTDVRYQLCCLGGHAPVYIAGTLQDNRFTIAGGQPGMEVCWQVTGIRQDRWAAAHRVPVEQDKPTAERGHYLDPELYGEPADKGMLALRYRGRAPAGGYRERGADMGRVGCGDHAGPAAEVIAPATDPHAEGLRTLD